MMFFFTYFCKRLHSGIALKVNKEEFTWYEKNNLGVLFLG